ncbi:MAG: GerMN domain-containing protein, partial [[Clostridium] innocuum]
SIKNGIVSLYFDDSLKNYDKENELRILEAITWGATQFHDIEQVKLYLNDKQLTSMPNAQTPIPEILNRSIGINHFETSTTTLHDSASLTVFYTKGTGMNTWFPKVSRLHRVRGCLEGEC